MDRRSFLTGLTATSVFLAGCTTENDPRETQTSRVTPATSTGQTVSVPRDGTVTTTFQGTLQLREFGWTDEELAFGTPGAAGMLENIGDGQVGQADVSVQFYDGDTQIGSNVSWHDFLAPGEYGRIEVPYTGDEPDRITRIQVSASSQSRLNSVNHGAVSVSDTGLRTNDNGKKMVSGSVENASDDRLRRVVIFVNFYNGQELLEQGRDAVERLAAGESAEWSVTAARASSEEVTRYRVVTTVQK